jgi:hypothetical protein
MTVMLIFTRVLKISAIGEVTRAAGRAVNIDEEENVFRNLFPTESNLRIPSSLVCARVAVWSPGS